MRGLVRDEIGLVRERQSRRKFFEAGDLRRDPAAARRGE
jgi:hypothetical protein